MTTIAPMLSMAVRHALLIYTPLPVLVALRRMGISRPWPQHYYHYDRRGEYSSGHPPRPTNLTWKEATLNRGKIGMGQILMSAMKARTTAHIRATQISNFLMELLAIKIIVPISRQRRRTIIADTLRIQPQSQTQQTEPRAQLQVPKPMNPSQDNPIYGA